LPDHNYGKMFDDQYNKNHNLVGNYSPDVILDSEIVYAPKRGQKLSSYLKDLKIHIDYSVTKNTSAHINGPKGAWYTHRSSRGCFMCENISMIKTQYHVLELVLLQSPGMKF